jgi:hypothetical protein
MCWILASRPALGAVGALAILGALGGCRSEQNFTPFAGFPELENDHGQWLSMARAPDGSPAVAFYDRTVGGLGFAIGDVRRDGIAWAYEEVDGYPGDGGLDPGDVGTYTDLVFGPDGTAWISYRDEAQGSLKVASRVNRVWTTEVVDPGSGRQPDTGRWTALAIGADGQPMVVYHDEVAGTLRMATRSAEGAWTATTVLEGEPFSGTDAEGNPVERPADVGEYAQILVEGNTHWITAYDRGQQRLVLLEGFPGAYVDSVIDDAGNVGAWPSLVKDGETLAIAYHDVGNGDLKLAVRDGGARFAISTLDDGRYRGADTALFKQGEQWGVVYFDGHENDQRLARQGTSGAWTTERVAGADVAAGFHNEVVQDGAGRWWIGSYDYTNRKMVVRPLE